MPVDALVLVVGAGVVVEGVVGADVVAGAVDFAGVDLLGPLEPQPASTALKISAVGRRRLSIGAEP